ncbi:MAG: ApaG domain, partial [Betaproteobacteria bacterium]|nr:ApaG domain [Betaproteobacteria bacterium]
MPTKFYEAKRDKPYTITITNHSDEPVQLLSRHWRITDGHG